MSMSTKFVPILQKSGPGRWWRWQNKIVFKSEAASASFGTMAKTNSTAYGQHHSTTSSRLPIYLDVENQSPLDLETQDMNQSWKPLGSEIPFQTLCSELQTKDPWATYFLPQHKETARDIIKSLPKIPERKLEPAFLDSSLSAAELTKRSY